MHRSWSLWILVVCLLSIPLPQTGHAAPACDGPVNGILTLNGDALLSIDTSLHVRSDSVSCMLESGTAHIHHTGGVLTIGDSGLPYGLSVTSDSEVVVPGLITANGRIAIESPRITVRGAIAAATIALSARDTVNLDNGSIVVSNQIDQGGTIEIDAGYLANGATMLATGPAGGHVRLAANSILQWGTVDASGTRNDGGSILINYVDRFLGTQPSILAANGIVNAGKVVIDGQGALFSSGRVEAAGDSGGTIRLLGNSVNLAAASVFADGVSGGGTILVGGAYQGSDPAVRNATLTIVNGASTLSANAIAAGNGGTVVIWSDGDTEADATITAKGGVLFGDGGFVELSGKVEARVTSTPDVTAPNGAPGSVLFDPKNIIIANDQLNLAAFELGRSVSAAAKFGETVVPLTNGNVVVTAPDDNGGGTIRGSVFLFNGVTGALISTVTGATDADQIGSTSAGGGVITQSTGSNFLIASTLWHNGVSTNVGAYTCVNGSNGVSGVVSSANSATGTFGSDGFGSTVTQLGNGKWVLALPFWSATGVGQGRGAVRLISNSCTSATGVITTTNSLFGGKNFDAVGSVVVAMKGASGNGKYVVGSPSWDNPAGANNDDGVATWCNGNGVDGCAGKSPTSTATSDFRNLRGMHADDNVGENIVALDNGNYVVVSPSYSEGATLNVGAVTLGASVGLESNLVTSHTFSLKGSLANDAVGSNGVVPLSDGTKYVVLSSGWNGTRGAVTLCNGTGGGSDGCSGVSATVSITNSLTGQFAGHEIGQRVLPLTNGKYIVGSPNYDNNPAPFTSIITNGGAISWCDPVTGGTYGSCASTVVSAFVKSLVGTSVNDSVPVSMIALPNGNAVITAPSFDHTGTDRGLVTWINGTTGAAANGTSAGNLGSANSFVGSFDSDQIGGSGITVLSDGNVVIASQNWSSNKGALTWMNGTTGRNVVGGLGAINATNSFVGAIPGDLLGNGTEVAVDNGAYFFAAGKATVIGISEIGVVKRLTSPITGTLAASDLIFGDSLNGEFGNGGLTLTNDGVIIARSTLYNSSACAYTIIDTTTGQPIPNSNSFLNLNNSHSGAVSNSNCQPVVTHPENGTVYFRYLNDSGGRVFVFAVDVSRWNFAFGQSAGLTTRATYVTRILNQGTTVTLQANTDITVTSQLLATNPSGNAGNLTLIAGRSITISNGIGLATNGNVSVAANHPSAICAQRDARASVISHTNGTINAGIGNVSFTMFSSPCGGASIGSIRTNTINGGAFSTSSTGPVLVGGNISTTSTIAFSGGGPVTLLNSVTLTSSTQSISFNGSTLALNGNGLTLVSPVPAVMPVVALSAGETITAPNGISFGTGKAFTGNGTINGPVTMGAGSNLAPGASVGTLQVGRLSLASGVTLNIEIGPAGTIDQIVSSGVVTVTGATLNVTKDPTFTPTPGQRLRFIDNNSGSDTVGTFAGLADGTVLTVGGTQFAVRYNAGAGHDVELVTLSTPTAATDAATGVSLSDATLNGTVDPNGLVGTVEFEYGTASGVYGSTVVAVPTADDESQAVTGALVGLTPNTTYFYRVKITTAGGSAFGTEQSFTTQALPPSGGGSTIIVLPITYLPER